MNKPFIKNSTRSFTAELRVIKSHQSEILNIAMFLVTPPIVINVPTCWKNACYCSVAGKFEYQKNYDLNVYRSSYKMRSKRH